MLAVAAVAVGPAAGRAQLQTGQAVAGVGARPLTETVAATWFWESVEPPETKTMAAVFFLLGEPGWTREKTTWTWGAGDPAFSRFEAGSWSLAIEFSTASGRWIVPGGEGLVSETNVIVLGGCGTAEPRVLHVERMDLVLPFDSDPMRAVVGRSAELRAILRFDE